MSNLPRWCIRVFAVGLCILFTKASPAGDRDWQRLSDGTLAIYTQGEQPEAGILLRSFNELRNALSQGSIFKVNQTAPLKVIAFASETQFNPYRLKAGSCAFFQQTQRHEYVVLQDLAPLHREVAAHEFTHFVLAHAGVQLPLWLNEGLADFYSSFAVADQQVIFGRSVSGRLPILRHNAWLPIASLFEISADSSYYSEPGRMALFYSESWALTHMLVVSPEYAPHFADFIHRLNAGQSSVSSAREAFGKDPDQIQQDLKRYLDCQHLPLLKVAISPLAANQLASMSKIANDEMIINLSDLAPSNLQAQASLEKTLAHAATQTPDHPEAEESLGYLALRQGKTSDARKHFEAAIGRHSSDAKVYFYLAHLNHEAGMPSSVVIPLLRQAISLQPQFSDARLELALISTADGDFQTALTALKNLEASLPQNAYAAAYTEAYCYFHLDKFAEASAAVRHAQPLAANDRDRAELAELSSFIEEQTSEIAFAKTRP